MDLMLPKKNGLQVAMELRNEGRDTRRLILVQNFFEELKAKVGN
jgi:CheY-like chemotaxis protein